MNNQYFLLGQKIVGWLTKEPYFRSPGLLCSAVKKGKPAKETVLPDLGDYLPFFYLFGAKNFCKTYLLNLEKTTNLTRIMCQKGPLGLPIVYSYDFSDLLLGLYWYYSRTKSTRAKLLIKRVETYLSATFGFAGRAGSLYSPMLDFVFPLIDSRDGMYLEIHCDYFYLFPNKKLINRLKDNLLLISDPIFPSFKAYSWMTIFKFLPKFRKSLNETIFIKHISNPLYGLISYYRLTNDLLVKTKIISLANFLIENFLTEDGFFLHRIKLKDGDVVPKGIHSASIHTAIDLFSDLAYFFKDRKYLDAAEKIAGAWIKIQGKTGLFPIKPDSEIDDLDSQTDMIIALTKIGEVSGKKIYKRVAYKCYLGIIKYHLKMNGLVLSVNIKSGRVVNSIFKTKFIALFLKVLYLYSTKRKIYDNPVLYQDLKDR